MERPPMNGASDLPLPQRLDELIPGDPEAFEPQAHRIQVPRMQDVKRRERRFDFGNRPQTLYPVYAWGHPDCEHGEFLAIGDPLREQPSQHPAQCRRKALPVSSAVPENGLFAYCVKRLPEGLRYVFF